MSKTQNSKPYDLRDRTFRFAKMVRNYVKNLPETLSNIEDARQLIKASGSVGANYIEAEFRGFRASGWNLDFERSRIMRG
jgi:four helix bundle protein